MPDCSTSKGWHTAFTVKLVHVGFAVTGMFMVLFGPSLPTLTRHWSLDDARAGYFFLAQFLGGVSTNVLAGYLIPVAGYRWSLVLGFSCMGLGTIFLASGPWALALVLAFIMGSGTGFLTTAINLWIGEAATQEQSGALSLVNFSWSAGAVACPFLVYFWQESSFALSFFQLLGCAAALLAIAFALLPRDALSVPARDMPRHHPPVARNAIDAFAFVFGLLIFLYVGAETALGGWLATYARRLAGEASMKPWVVTPSFFWGGMMLGRILGPAILRRIGNLRAVQTGVMVCLVGTAFLIRASTLSFIFLNSIIIGLGCSVVFPVLISWLLEYYGASARRITGAMLALSGLGAAIVPWGVGFTSTRMGGLKYGLWVLLLVLVVCMTLLTLYGWPRDTTSAEPTSLS